MILINMIKLFFNFYLFMSVYPYKIDLRLCLCTYCLMHKATGDALFFWLHE